MDGPLAFSACCARSGDCLCHRRARESRSQGISDLSSDLVDEYRHDRKRPLDRDRGALRFALRARHHFLVELLDSKEIRVAHLDSWLDFSRAWHAHERAHASCIFLCDCAGRPLEGKELAISVSP